MLVYTLLSSVRCKFWVINTYETAAKGELQVLSNKYLVIDFQINQMFYILRKFRVKITYIKIAILWNYLPRKS